MRFAVVFVLVFLMMAAVVAATSTTASIMSVSLESQEPDPAMPGQYVELRWKVENKLYDVDDLEFKLEPEFPFYLDPDDEGYREVGTLHGKKQGNDAVILYYRLRVDKDAVEGNNNTLRLRYRTKGTASWVVTSPFMIRVRTSDAILSVVSVMSEPEVIEPGKTGIINIGLKNQGDSSLHNIKVKWDVLTITSSRAGTVPSLTELPFTPVGSTNEKTVDSLGAGEETNVSFKAMVSPDAESKDYKVEIGITYKDYLMHNFSLTNVMGLIVGNTPDVDVYLDSSAIVMRGMGGEVSIKVVNKDVMDIKFGNVELAPSDCYEILSPEIVYLGNIDSDDYETAEYDLYLNPKGICENLPMSVTYKDANNNEYVKEVLIPLKLYTKRDAINLGLVEGSSAVGFIIFLVIIVGGVLGWRRWRKRKKR